MTALTPADYIEIYQLYAAYALATDTGDGAARAATFTADGTMSSYRSNHQPQSVAAIREHTNTRPKKRIPDARMMHIQTGIHLTSAETGADGTCYAILATEDETGTRALTPAFYTDTLVKTPAGWRFKTREVFVGAPGDATY